MRDTNGRRTHVTPTIVDRIVGCLKGIATGDAMGKQTEMRRARTCCVGIRTASEVSKGRQAPSLPDIAERAAAALVLQQMLPSGGVSSWAYVLYVTHTDSTRLLFRRRGNRPSLFDRLMKPGYYFMDMGMLAGIKERVEQDAGPQPG
jgi:hypothetical protein